MRSRVLVNRGSALTWPRCQSLRCDCCFSFLSAKSVLIQGCEDLAPCVLGKPCPFDSLCWSSVGLEQLGSVLCGRERARFRRRAVLRHRQVTVALRPVALAPPVTLTSVGAIHSVSFVTVLLVWRSRPHGNLRIPEAGRWIRQKMLGLQGAGTPPSSAGRFLTTRSPLATRGPHTSRFRCYWIFDS